MFENFANLHLNFAKILLRDSLRRPKTQPEIFARKIANDLQSTPASGSDGLAMGAAGRSQRLPVDGRGSSRRAAFGLGRGDAVYTMAFRRLPRFSTTDNFDELERRLQPASVLCCSSLWTGSPRLDRSIGRPPTKRENFAKLQPSRESAATHPNFAKISSFREAT